MARGPQTPAIRPSDPATAEPVPLWWVWTGLALVGLAVVAFFEGALSWIASRWRGIVLAHVFFLTLWLAIQAFFFATGSHWCFPSENPNWLEGLLKYFPQMSRCLPVSATTDPKPVPPRNPPAAPSHNPPAVQFHGATTPCWRDRSLDGNCFARAEPHRKSPPPRLRNPPPPPFPCYRYHNCGWDDI